MLRRRHRLKPTRMPNKREKPRRGPARSPEFLAWIRSLPCAVCQRGPTVYFPVEAAHTHGLGPRGMGQKSSDFSAIPLCFWHHRGDSDSYHELGEKRFAAQHGLDIPGLVRRLNDEFSSRRGPGREDSSSLGLEEERSA